jgi:hypothetical protein
MRTRAWCGCFNSGVRRKTTCSRSNCGMRRRRSRQRTPGAQRPAGLDPKQPVRTAALDTRFLSDQYR